MDIVLNDNRLPISEFSFDQMVSHASIVMIAKRGSGKSYVCRALLDHYRDIPCGIIISPTDRLNAFYGNFFPESFIYYEYKSEIIENVLRRQELIKDKNEEKRKQGKKIDTRTFVLMDDCLSNVKSWGNDKPIKDLLFNGRHYDIMYILTMQFPLGISPELRTNFDYVFLLADDNTNNIKRLYEHYAGCFPSLAAFKQVFTEMTKDFGCMVLNNRGARHNLFEKIFYYKAPRFDENKDKITFGCKQFRDYHEKNFDPKWSNKYRYTNNVNIESFLNKKGKDKTDIKIRIV